MDNDNQYQSIPVNTSHGKWAIVSSISFNGLLQLWKSPEKRTQLDPAICVGQDGHGDPILIILG